MWNYLEILRVDAVDGGWRAVAQMEHNGIPETVMLPGPNMVFQTEPTDVELRIMGEHVALKLNVAAANPPTYTLSKFAFRTRFTRDERVAMDNAATSTTLSDEQKAHVRTILKDLEAIEGPVDITHEITIAGVNYMEEVGILSFGRARQVLGLE